MKMSFRKGLHSSIIMEIYVWVLISLIISGRPLYYYLLKGISLEALVLEFYSEILSSVLLLLFPFLFKQIFWSFPLEYLRYKRRKISPQNRNRDFDEADEKVGTGRPKLTTDQHKTTFVKEEIHLLERNLTNARELSEKVYSRSGAYLLIGCLIAFTGVFIFYSQTSAINTSDEDTWTNITIAYIPRVGTLIFVEALAFFFLKQYRLTMDEFRYYESIKRQRENQLTTLKFLYEFKDKPKLFDKLIVAISFNEIPIDYGLVKQWL